MKKYSDDDNTRTDVNGAWKPLKPLQEGYEFVGDDQYDNFLTKKGRERRNLRKDLRESGMSRKDARKKARQDIPKGKNAKRDAYLTLVKMNFRGFAWKLNAIITGTNPNLINELKQKWSKFGDWNSLIDAVNKGKDKKPFVCGAKCREEAIQKSEFNNFVILGVTVTSTMLVAVASAVIGTLGSVVKQAQIGKQQRDVLELEEKKAQNDFNNLPPEKRQEILDAEKALKQDVQTSENKKYIWIGVGVVALISILVLIKNKK